MLVWEGGGRREAPVRPGRPSVCRRVRRRRGPPPLTAAPAPFGTLHRLRQMETKTKRSAARDRVVLGDGFNGSRLGPQEGEAVRCIFFGAWRARAAETEEGGAGETRARAGVPPHRRAEDLARQATCRPVSGTKRSQEHSEASVSRVYRR